MPKSITTNSKIATFSALFNYPILIEDEATHITTNQQKVEFWILNDGFEASNTLLQKLLHYQSHEAGHLKGATLIQKFATQLLFYLDKLKKNLSNKAIQLD